MTVNAYEEERAYDLALAANGGRVPGESAADRMRSLLLVGDRALSELPEPIPLVHDFLDGDTTAALFAPWGSYKTVLATDLACSVATGLDWHGRPVTAGTVLYVLAEGAFGQDDKVQAWKAVRDVSSEIPGLVTLPVAVNLYSDSESDVLREVALELEPSLIVYDTLNRCMVGADENSARDMGRVVENIDQIRRATHACVLVVHHSGKNIDAGLRGSSVLAGAMDTVLRLSATDNIVELVEDKQKYRVSGRVSRFKTREVHNTVVLQRHDGYIDTDHLPASLIEMLVSLRDIDAGNGASTSVWRTATTVAERTFYRHVKTLQEKALTANFGSDKKPRWTVTTTGLQAIDCQGAM